MVAILPVLDLACTRGTHDHDRDVRPATSTPEAPATSLSSALTVPTASASTTASAPVVSIPCRILAPPLPVLARDSQVFTSVLRTRRRMDVQAVEGRLLFAGSSRAVTHHGPANEYVNQLHELEGDTLRPAAGLQRGLWPDFSLWGAWGHWPDTVLMVGPNYGNTAWEHEGFQWNAGKGEWVNREMLDPPIQWGWGSPWEWTEEASGSNRSVSAASPVGIPRDLCDGVASCARLDVVAPRDLYATDNPCGDWSAFRSADGHRCDVTKVLHWCAPRPRFEASMAPRAIPNAGIIAVPGTALVFGAEGGQEPTFDRGLMFRDGDWTPVKPPEALFHRSWLVSSGGSIWYLGNEGLYQLGEGGFKRVSVWRREYGNDADAIRTNAMGRSKVTLPGADGPAALTGFLARTAEELWLTTWNGKETQIWCTSRDRKIKGG